MGETTHGEPKQVDLVWARPERRAQGQKPALTREQIVRATIEIADADGAQAISMRRIAAKLGVGTMSLYWHVSSKQDLLDLALDAIFGEVAPPDRLSGDWRADLRAIAFLLRATLRRHPWLVSFIFGRPPLGPNGLRNIETGLSALDHLGLDTTIALGILATVNTYVVGFVMNETAEEEVRRRSGLTEAEWQVAIAPYVRRLIASNQFPHLERVISATTQADAEDLDNDASFAFGLDCLLDGIAVRITAASAGMNKSSSHEVVDTARRPTASKGQAVDSTHGDAVSRLE